AGLYLPFKVAGQQLAYQANWQIQHAKTPIVPADYFTIGNRYAVRDDFFDKYLQTVAAGGKTAFQPQPLTGKDELRELEALMRLLRNHGVNALFVMQPLHPMVFRDLDRFTPVQRQVEALCARYAMACMDMYDAPYEIGTLRDVQHLGELGWLRVNQRIAEVFRP
ncbi:D-alanyl-lipoteichoic acid biosynthesis protein DltD, partial [Escherichia coli]|uniref:D-alanyl-lipoteichoic acid biosynthesis protein DltD n=1 Tax=Escherichia coli TaxID=562 RepID=UPI0022826FD0